MVRFVWPGIGRDHSRMIVICFVKEEAIPRPFASVKHSDVDCISERDLLREHHDHTRVRSFQGEFTSLRIDCRLDGHFLRIQFEAIQSGSQGRQSDPVLTVEDLGIEIERQTHAVVKKIKGSGPFNLDRPSPNVHLLC